MANVALPPELVSLVHHVELNKAGWWNRAIQRFVVGVIWLSSAPLSASEVAGELRSRFGVDIDDRRLKQQVEALQSVGTVLPLADGRLKISEKALKDLEGEIQEAENVEAKAREKFTKIFKRCCPTLESDQGWNSFTENLLLPLVREIGARTYQLISGASFSLESTSRFPQFLASYPAESRQAVRDAIVRFLDPKDPNVRSYLLRHLNAYFFVEAGNLGAGAVESLNRIAERPPSFKVFVDTNFLFSFLGLHENPSNDAAKSLMDLTTQLEGKISCRFYVSPLTLDETKRVIGSHRDFLHSLRLPPNLAQAAIESNLSGIARKFVETSRRVGLMSADDYFRPYLTDLKTTLRAKTIEFFNEPMESFSTSQDVVDDIVQQLDFEKSHYGKNAKTYESLEHDLVLWHFVRSKRPVRVESPLEASYWIVTVDYHFLGFDSFKNRSSSNEIPICLHPTALIQMLQFWLPRTARFEEAALGSLRWPFLFQDFDPEAEKVTIRILAVLARFENITGLPQEVVTSILVNDALRSKLAVEGDVQKQIELVKEALVEENEKTRSQLAAATEEATRLKGEVEAKDTEIGKLRELVDTNKATIRQAQTSIDQERTAREAIESLLNDLAERLANNSRIRRFVVASLAVLASAFAIAAIVAAFARPVVGFWKTCAVAWTGIGVTWSWIVDRLGERNPAVRGWSVHSTLHALRIYVFGVIAWVVLWTWFEGVGSLFYRWLRSGPHS